MAGAAMYSYEWDAATRGYRLTTTTGRFVASELRPVFAEELILTGLDARLRFDPDERLPLLWARQNTYLHCGEEIARLIRTRYGAPLRTEWRGILMDGADGTSPPPEIQLAPVDVAGMLEGSRSILDSLVVDTLKRIKEMHDVCAGRGNIVYIGFSGGKDSAVLLDLCHQVLPLDVPVVFSDTDMELPDTWRIWDEVRERHAGRPFLKARARRPALENWETFGPPSRAIRWCCAVHKSAPALLLLRERSGNPAATTAAFLGVRREESLNRQRYEDIGEGVKVASQTNLMPLLDWGAHELWLYALSRSLPVNRAYRQGFARVGCVMCPESSDRYAWFVEAAHPGLARRFHDVIIRTSAKSFSSRREEEDFLGENSWQARKSGAVLKRGIPPASETADALSVSWTAEGLDVPLFLEWLKTVGNLFREEEEGRFRLRVPGGDRGGVGVSLDGAGGGRAVRIFLEFADAAERRRILPMLRAVLHKAQGCVACQACEAECPAGALTLKDGSIAVDAARCIHCRRCHAPDLGCWRYRSMRIPETSASSLNGINMYKNFGLRTDFVAVYLDERENFDQTERLNRAKQVPAAKAWFRQALLMEEKTSKPTLLLDVFDRRGLEDPLAWDCVWLGLCNHAPLIRWFIHALEWNRAYGNDELPDLLGNIKDVTKRGGLQALKNTLVATPLGAGPGAVCELERRGATTVAVTRRPRSADRLAVLYGLYVMAEKAKRGAFTVRQMLEVPLEDGVASPLAAFGMSPDEFKRQCQGLATDWPDLIACSFTLGLDEVRVFPERNGRDGVLKLILDA